MLPFLGRLGVAVAFFASGAAALVYQVAWQRILALHSGVGIYSIAMIVAAFLVGLGLGSELGGRLSLRVGHKAALRAFVLLELAIALFGAASGWLYYDVLYQRAGFLYTTPWSAGLTHFASLVLPTLAMGMSLPFLARARVRSAAQAGRTVGLLYSVNLLGAAVGAFSGPWFLVRNYGIRGALLAAALANLLAALAALGAGWLDAEQPLDEQAEADPARAGLEPATPLAVWALLYAFSGFCALSLEMLWFRIIDVAVKSTAFTFGTVLAVYLLGNAMGTLLGVAVAGRLRRPLRAFLIAQCAILLYAAALVTVLGRAPVDGAFSWIFALYTDAQSYDPGGQWTTAGILRAYLALPLVLYGPPTLLMGLSFTILQRAVHDDVQSSGRKVGLLQAANIAGCVAGSLLIGLGALTWWGTMGTLRALLVVGLGFAALGLRRCGLRSPFAPAAAALLALFALVPGQGQLWPRLHSVPPEPMTVDEDATGVIALSPVQEEAGRFRMWVNGRRHSVLPFGGVHTILGAVPALVHPRPREVAVIGLGSGDTAWAAGCRGADTGEITVFEICAPEQRLLAGLASRPDAPLGLPGFLRDPRMRMRLADGRNALQRGDRRYDVIEMDALHPSSPYSGNLYSEEFFALCARRLNPGGLLSTWSPTPRTFATVLKVFPYVLQVSDRQVLVASNDPIALTPDVWQARLARADVQAYLGAEQAAAIGRELAKGGLTKPRRFRKTDYNLDLYPRDEFGAVN